MSELGTHIQRMEREYEGLLAVALSGTRDANEVFAERTALLSTIGMARNALVSDVLAHLYARDV